MIKAIFFDIDGTLVSFKTHKIPNSTIKALHLLKEKGIKLFIATARGKDGLDILNQFDFDGYITLNGQYCYDKDGTMLYEDNLCKEDLKNLIEYIEENDIPCGFTEEETKYYNKRNHEVDELHKITKNDAHLPGDYHQALVNKIYQVQVFVNELQQVELMKKMPNSTAARWYPTFCDISPLGGSKKNGIIEVCKYYNIDVEETMAFGDGGNDIPMLLHVGISVGMGNANEEVKNIVDYVTSDVDSDGIYNALKHYNIL